MENLLFLGVPILKYIRLVLNCHIAVMNCSSGIIGFGCALDDISKTSGPGCSKLTTSLVNVSLKFQTLISQICHYFL